MGLPIPVEMTGRSLVNLVDQTEVATA